VLVLVGEATVIEAGEDGTVVVGRTEEETDNVASVFADGVDDRIEELAVAGNVDVFFSALVVCCTVTIVATLELVVSYTAVLVEISVLGDAVVDVVVVGTREVELLELLTAGVTLSKLLTHAAALSVNTSK
jgi:hypothetical protein